MAVKLKRKELSLEEKRSLLQNLQTKFNYQNLISKEELLKIDYDNVADEDDRGNYKDIATCMAYATFSEFSYALYVHNFYSKKYRFFNIRLIHTESINGLHSYYICPAIKVDEDMAKKKILPVTHNRLGLTPGKVTTDIDDLPKVKLDNTNSYYDPKLKRRVPNLESFVKQEKALPEFKLDNAEKKKPKELKVEADMINNTDVLVELASRPHSSQFLPPHVCTRIWVLGIGTDTGWAWFVKNVEGSKTKMEYYCRPEILSGHEWQLQYDRGGSMITKAFFKWEFSKLDNDVLAHNNLFRIVGEMKSETWNQEINCLIDSFIIEWR